MNFFEKKHFRSLPKKIVFKKPAIMLLGALETDGIFVEIKANVL